MNGAESLVHTLIKCGIKVCFANPGTSEMHFVAALDRIPGLRCIPGLQENVVTGMADGYARVMRVPAATLLHCGPGLANGLANLHNARKARVPIVNIVGEQATYHAQYEPPLASDTVDLARAVSHWVRVSTQSDAVGADGAAAVAAACSGGGQVATLILPSDSSWNSGGVTAELIPPTERKNVTPQQIDAAAKALNGAKVLLLLGAEGLMANAQVQAMRIAAHTGCSVMAESINGFQARGAGRMSLERVPYNADMAIAALKDFTHVVLAGARNPVGFFAYPGKPSLHAPADVSLATLCDPGQDAVGALAMLADALHAPKSPPLEKTDRPSIPKGQPSSFGFGQLLAAVMPEDSLIVDEAISFAPQFFAGSKGAPPHDWMMVTGGAIGFGMPCATGAAVAGGGRRVINAQADGSAMYTIQSLWTQAREKLPVTTIILNNHKYQILIGEYAGVGANPGPTAMNMLDLGNPDIDFVRLANSMGVEAARATTLENCADLMLSSFCKDGPFLIDLHI